jgi:hypothetical protein
MGNRTLWCRLGLLAFFFASSGYSLTAQDSASEPPTSESSQFGDFTLKYGYSYLRASERSTSAGGVGPAQKLPGQFQFFLSSRLDLFVRSDSLTAKKKINDWQVGAGDTYTGIDWNFRQDASRVPEIDGTFDAKIPISSFAPEEVDYEFYGTVIHAVGRNSFEVDLGDYLEGFVNRSYSHSFEFTGSDRFGVGRPNQDGSAFKWKSLIELDVTTASPDTPTDVHQVFTIRRELQHGLKIEQGVRISYTPYVPRFAVFVNVRLDSSIRHKQ